MKVQQIKEMAQRMDIPAGKMKKSDLIHSIQTREGNAACYDTGRSSQCGQQNCLWVEDCK